MTEPEVDLDEIQGDVTPGFGVVFRQYVFVTTNHVERLRSVLASWHHRVTYASDARLAVLVGGRFERPSATADPPSTMINVGLSSVGLRWLSSAQWVADVPDAPFRNGMRSGAAFLGDPDPDTWTIGAPSAPIHTMFSLGSQSRDHLLETVRDLVTDLSSAGEVTLAQDDVLERPATEREPFGFRDGISQPALRGRWRGCYLAGRDDADLNRHRAGKRLVWPGQFLLGLPRSSSEAGRAHASTPTIPSWLTNSSLLVWRKLEQDVEGFTGSCVAEARRLSVSAELIAARRVGRWRSGAPLVSYPTSDESVVGTDLNSFDYRDDPHGQRCPFDAHIRRMNPRDADDGDYETGRFLLRRGIPYVEKSGEVVRRGLVFVAYQASIAEQFEYLQLNRGVRVDLDGTSDGLLGAGGGSGTRVQSPWVTLTGGEYFLVPSRSLLAGIVEVPSPSPTDRTTRRLRR